MTSFGPLTLRKVRVLHPARGKGGPVLPGRAEIVRGETIVLSELQAGYLIERGLAELVNDAPPAPVQEEMATQ